MKTSDFPERIFVADIAPAGAEHTELTYSENREAVSGLPSLTYIPESEIDWERLARTKVHPLRISILEVLMIDGGRTLSPNEIGFELQVGLSNVSYHVKELFKAGFIELVGTEQRRGASEHYYRLTSKGGGGDEG